MSTLQSESNSVKTRKRTWNEDDDDDDDVPESSSVGNENLVKNGMNIRITKSEVDEIFEKKFKYQKMEGPAWTLPSATEMFKEYFQLNSLQQLKEALNCVRSKLNEYDIEAWSRYTNRRDPLSEVRWRLKQEVPSEFVTVAWCKFYECLHQYPLVTGSQLNSLHLCEAPGAFVAALNHYLYTTFNTKDVKWKWLATTLNPYYEGNTLNEMITDDRFMLPTLENWFFCEDFTGNILDNENIASLQRLCMERFQCDVHLITADGSIECNEEPSHQEDTVSKLNYAEICAALTVLSKGGCFVLKMFTIFEAASVCKMFLLNCVFEEVHVFKPASSRHGNSEIYVICLKFQKTRVAHLPAVLTLMKSKLADQNPLPMFQKSQIPKEFLMQHEICARRFMNLQINAIESNVRAFELKSRDAKQRSHILRTLVWEKFAKRYNIQPLRKELMILHKTPHCIQPCEKILNNHGSYTERRALKDWSVEEQIFKVRGLLNKVSKSLETTRGVLFEAVDDGAHENRVDMKVYRGSPFQTLHTSLFVAKYLLLVRKEVCTTASIDPLSHFKAKCTFNGDATQSLALDSIDSKDMRCSDVERKFLASILCIVLEKRPKQLVFSNYALLTHLSVSVLYFLSHNCFERFMVATHPSFDVSLEQCCYSDELVRSLETLKDLLESDERVLCVVDIKKLHRNEFCDGITKFNNSLLLSALHSMLA